MKRRVIIGICAAIIAASLLARSNTINIMLSLFLTGSLPGTNFVMPFWAMMAFYLTAASLLIAWYAESLIVARRLHLASKKQRMPRRRYSHI